MKTIIFKKSALIFLLMMTLSSNSIYSQKIEEIEVSGLLISTDLDDGISYGLSMGYNYWMNPYLGFTVGGMMNYSKINMNFDSVEDDKVYYDFDAPVFNLNAMLGLKFSSPVFKNMGLSADLKFMFEPIPYDYVDIQKKIIVLNQSYPDEKDKAGFVFTQFNPSYVAEVSLFYESKTEKLRGRIHLGVGITNHNPYIGYYRSKIDGMYLRDHLKLKPDDVSFILFVRLSGVTKQKK